MLGDGINDAPVFGRSRCISKLSANASDLAKNAAERYIIKRPIGFPCSSIIYG